MRVPGPHSAADRPVVSEAAGDFRYGAFISYSHVGDREFVREFQRGLERFAKPWNKIRSTRIFRDESNLTAAPGLWSVLEEALESSEWFILVASTESAASEWVQKEVLWWLERREVDRILIVLTSGEIRWDEVRNDFDSEVTTAVPKALHGVLPQEPLWVDARWSRDAGTYDIDDPRMRQTVVDVASPVRGVDKDTLVGEAEREHRRTRRVTRAAIVGLATLLVMALASTGLAWVQRNAAVEATNAAREVTRVAQARQLASLALQYAEEDVGLAATFALVRSHDGRESSDYFRVGQPRAGQPTDDCCCACVIANLRHGRLSGLGQGRGRTRRRRYHQLGSHDGTARDHGTASREDRFGCREFRCAYLCGDRRESGARRVGRIGQDDRTSGR